MMNYLILVSSDNTRDVQVYAGPLGVPDKHISEQWQDYSDAEIYVGIFPAKSEAEALTEAAAQMRLPVTSLRAVCLGSERSLLRHEDALLQLRRYYELDDFTEGTPEYLECVRRFRADFIMTPKAMAINKWKILTRACALFDKFCNANVAENDIWDHIIPQLRDEYQIIRRDKGGQTDESV